MLLNPNAKYLTIEDTPELKLPHQYWVRLFSRPAFFSGTKEVGMDELVKLALRYRPDYVVVGEVRGTEIANMVQAVATGHGGVTTFHGSSMNDLFTRILGLLEKDVAKEFTSLLSCVVIVNRIVNPKDRSQVRRVLEVYENSPDGMTSVFRWTPSPTRQRQGRERGEGSNRELPPGRGVAETPGLVPRPTLGGARGQEGDPGAPRLGERVGVREDSGSAQGLLQLLRGGQVAQGGMRLETTEERREEEGKGAQIGEAAGKVILYSIVLFKTKDFLAAFSMSVSALLVLFYFQRIYNAVLSDTGNLGLAVDVSYLLVAAVVGVTIGEAIIAPSFVRRLKVVLLREVNRLHGLFSVRVAKLLVGVDRFQRLVVSYVDSLRGNIVASGEVEDGLFFVTKYLAYSLLSAAYVVLPGSIASLVLALTGYLYYVPLLVPAVAIPVFLYYYPSLYYRAKRSELGTG